eukprot:11036658-Prorocentrum_lima.AAC.1
MGRLDWKKSAPSPANLIMPAVLSGAKLTGRANNVKAERMPGTASLRCASNMGAEGELVMKTKSS